MSGSTGRGRAASLTERPVSNAELWRQAQEIFPGGVNSPVRAFRAVGGEPRFLVRGDGPFVHDADDKRYIDLVGSWGPLILGHAHPAVVSAAQTAIAKGSTFGAPTPGELDLGRLVIDAMPSIERVRLVSSGTEAVMSALRLARAFTGRRRIVKFEGCYHGHVDSMLVAAGSGATTLGVPNSPGVTPAQTGDTLLLPYNDLEAFDRLMDESGPEIAAVIVEPVAGNMGVVPPRLGFLDGLRRRTEETETLLIFDEVMTGFRVGWGGAQELYQIRPDLTTLSKILGGGFPMGAYGGRADVMEQVAPVGPMYQAGTLSGNPVAVAAGAAQLRVLSEPGVYQRLEASSDRLAEGFAQAFREAGVSVHVARVGSMGTVFFHAGEVGDYAGALGSDSEQFGRWFHAMLSRGVYLPPSQFEAWFVSTAHSEEVIDQVIQACRGAAQETSA